METLKDLESMENLENFYAEKTKIIQQNALVADGKNRVSRELTYQQALSIYLRSLHLMESAPVYNNYEKRRQIEECYRQVENVDY